MRNRLKLDWALITSDERNQFVSNYIKTDLFNIHPPTEEELETMGNYILWGKNDEGQNLEQEGLVEMPRRNSTWTTKNIDSLDELTENPTFNENSIYSLSSQIPSKKTREVFSRKEARANAPFSLLPYFEGLWRQIDEVDLLINYYELGSGKRKKEPRNELLNAFTVEEQDRLRLRALNMKQYRYLKMRHLLVELRREQYTMKDSYSERVLLRGQQTSFSDSPNVFGTEIPVFPLGMKDDTKKDLTKIIFRDFSELVPKELEEEEILEASKFFWQKQEQEKGDLYFDFRDLEMVYQLFLKLEELGEEDSDDLFSTTSQLLITLNFYIDQAELTEVHKSILDLKIGKQKNQDIASYINKTYGKTYTTNYISTIFRQKIIPLINRAAAYHEQIIGSLPFEEEFKTCTKCGRILLRDPANFVRKSRAKDGLSNHCKACDKRNREEKKKKEEEEKEVNKNE